MIFENLNQDDYYPNWYKNENEEKITQWEATAMYLSFKIIDVPEQKIPEFDHITPILLYNRLKNLQKIPLSDFKTKKEADNQRKAMFANGYKG